MWTIHLFKNDIVPFPGINNGDFTEADYPSYSSLSFTVGDFGPVSTASHVSSSVSSSVLQFIAASSGFSLQTIYGYWFTDGSLNYVLSERFGTPYDMIPDGVLNITPRVQNQTLPA